MTTGKTITLTRWTFVRFILKVTFLYALLGFPGGSDSKAFAAVRETWVQSLGQKDLLEKEMAPHSSTLAWKIPWTEEPGRPQYMGSQRVGHDRTTSLSFWLEQNFNSRR